MESVEFDHEVGDAVTVGVAAKIGVAADLFVMELAGNAGERSRADEREGLVAGKVGVGIVFL